MHTLDLMYFGDQSVEPFESILQLVTESRNSFALGQFLHSSFAALKRNLVQLLPVEQELFRADTFETLARSVQRSKACNAATTTVLSCVAQLGWAILFVYAIFSAERTSWLIT
jgi:hypothetical protein